MVNIGEILFRSMRNKKKSVSVLSTRFTAEYHVLHRSSTVEITKYGPLTANVAKDLQHARGEVRGAKCILNVSWLNIASMLVPALNMLNYGGSCFCL